MRAWEDWLNADQYINGKIEEVENGETKRNQTGKQINMERDGDRAERHHADSLPKRDTRCLTKAANLQKMLRQEEKRGKGGRRREYGKGKQGRKDVCSDTGSKREVMEIKDIAQQERNGETWKKERTDTMTQRNCTEGKVHGKEFKSCNSENKPVFQITCSFIVHTLLSSPFPYWRNVLHYPRLWQEWRGNTGSGS